MLDGPGLTVTCFLELLSDRDVKRFLDSDVLSVLDAIFSKSARRGQPKAI